MFLQLMLLGHAFCQHADPRVGSTVNNSPPAVRIWYDDELKEDSCKIQVKDAQDNRVDKDDAHLVDPKSLEISLKPLSPGKYRVFWNVVDEDGHPTEGDFCFHVANP